MSLTPAAAGIGTTLVDVDDMFFPDEVVKYFTETEGDFWKVGVNYFYVEEDGTKTLIFREIVSANGPIFIKYEENKENLFIPVEGIEEDGRKIFFEKASAEDFSNGYGYIQDVNGREINAKLSQYDKEQEGTNTELIQFISILEDPSEPINKLVEDIDSDSRVSKGPVEEGAGYEGTFEGITGEKGKGTIVLFLLGLIGLAVGVVIRHFVSHKGSQPKGNEGVKAEDGGMSVAVIAIALVGLTVIVSIAICLVGVEWLNSFFESVCKKKGEPKIIRVNNLETVVFVLKGEPQINRVNNLEIVVYGLTGNVYSLIINVIEFFDEHFISPAFKRAAALSSALIGVLFFGSPIPR